MFNNNATNAAAVWGNLVNYSWRAGALYARGGKCGTIACMGTHGKHGKSAAPSITVRQGVWLCAAAIAAVALVACLVSPAAEEARPTAPVFGESGAAAAGQTVCTRLGNAAHTAWSGIVDRYITPDALNSLDAAAGQLSGFALAPGSEAVQLTDAQSAAINEALSHMTASHSTGVLFCNLSTGKGLAYNLDERVYGASSFKGPYAAYLCQHLADGQAGLSSSARSLMASMVTQSDNDAFKTLRNTYDSSGFTGWLSECGVATDIASDTHFPRYSARESALLWLRTYRYLNAGSETASTLADLFKQTNVSFIRNGVGEVDGQATVLNKAGWSASGTRFTGLCDAGLIEATDGTVYLMSLMSNAPDGSPYTGYLANLATALYSAKGALN